VQGGAIRADRWTTEVEGFTTVSADHGELFEPALHADALAYEAAV